MHIPDGFIPLWQCAIYFLIAAPFVYLSLRWANKE
ncbi:MAG: energy-coupling factor ABC transporter permease, partial [Thermoplasmata archaeon]|nr:energy-coupling factor ABC transporter permease [Thermoplasmata archaeon]